MSNDTEFTILHVFRLDFDKFTSAMEDVKQGITERLRQWAEYETQVGLRFRSDFNTLAVLVKSNEEIILIWIRNTALKN